MNRITITCAAAACALGAITEIRTSAQASSIVKIEFRLLSDDVAALLGEPIEIQGPAAINDAGQVVVRLERTDADGPFGAVFTLIRVQPDGSFEQVAAAGNLISSGEWTIAGFHRYAINNNGDIALTAYSIPYNTYFTFDGLFIAPANGGLHEVTAAGELPPPGGEFTFNDLGVVSGQASIEQLVTVIPGQEPELLVAIGDPVPDREWTFGGIENSLFVGAPDVDTNSNGVLAFHARSTSDGGIESSNDLVLRKMHASSLETILATGDLSPNGEWTVDRLKAPFLSRSNDVYIAATFDGTTFGLPEANAILRIAADGSVSQLMQSLDEIPNRPGERLLGIHTYGFMAPNGTGSIAFFGYPDTSLRQAAIYRADDDGFEEVVRRYDFRNGLSIDDLTIDYQYFPLLIDDSGNIFARVDLDSNNECFVAFDTENRMRVLAMGGQQFTVRPGDTRTVQLAFPAQFKWSGGANGRSIVNQNGEVAFIVHFTDGTTALAVAQVIDTCDGDTDGDGVVNVADLLSILSTWGPCTTCNSDIDADGSVDVFDLLTVLANWGPCPTE